MNWFKKFMYGRYGVDQLSMVLPVFSFVLLCIRPLRYISVLGYIPMIFCIYRTFSKNIFKRKQENYKYLKLKNSFILWLKGYKRRLNDRKTHKYFTCPNCKQKLRVPKGKGKITITCPKCKTAFKGKA